MKNKFCIYLILILFSVYLGGCSGQKTISEFVNTIKDTTVSEKKDSIVNNQTNHLKEIYFKGFKDSFSIQPDSLGNIIPFHKTFDNGVAKGDYGYDKEKGVYWNIEADDTSTKDQVTNSHTFQNSESNTEQTYSDQLISMIEKSKGWSLFQWVQFWSFIILIGIILWKLRRILLKIPFVSRALKFI
ncbi:hypothetical protein [Abyssalbus ytuae]|uniref:Uncharacterized protein n=1 Tax=Abyssalbus ytuae TaxID=2926907 RepID=A0A9E7D468_9FLAO|nr:hypothetical protein [Abyssalbus ytuae]UOB18579.1 hypothetical protein MQE35_04645 [Abyssalbus ytuae]